MKKTDVEKRADKKFFDIFTNSDATSLEELQAEFEKSDPALSRELTIELLTRRIEEIRKPANFGQTCRQPGSPPLSPREKRDKLYELIKKQLEKDIRAMRVQNRKDMVTAEEILELRASLRAKAAKKKAK